MVKGVVSVFVIDAFQCRYRTDGSGCGVCGYGKVIGFYKVLDNQLLIISSFHVCHENLIGQERLNIFLLIGEDVCFMCIHKIVIDHAPHGCFTGTGYKGNDFNGVLSVKYIVDAVPATDLYRIYLIQIKVCGCLLNVFYGQVTLIFLIGNQILYGNQLIMDIRDELL